MGYNFALMKYSTENIGDEVQSIAARRFLPRIDEYVDRDQLADWSPDKPTKIIMNGWYNRNPSGWPPKNIENIVPLLTSIHVSVKDHEVKQVFESRESLEFLSKKGPVGARDQKTLEFFKDNNLDAYFSGCVTLTLQRDPEIKKQDFILAVDVPKKVVEKMRESTDREIIELTVYHFPFLQNEERFKVTEFMLALYQSAHAVVTTRLHCFLPSLAFETPVLLIKDSEKYEPNRYGGLDVLPRSLTDEEYVKNPTLFPLDDPLENPKKYLEIRNAMIERARNFTGFSNDETFRTIPLEKLPLDISTIRIFAYAWNSTFKKALLEGDLAWDAERIADFERIIGEKSGEIIRLISEKEEISKNLTAEIKVRDEEIADLRNSISWMITKPLRKISSLIRKIVK